MSVQDEILLIKDQRITCSQNSRIQSTDWSACDVVIEASGKHNRKNILEDYLTQGVKRVVVTAPVKEDGVLNVVMGINDYCLESGHHSIVTAASWRPCRDVGSHISNDSFVYRHSTQLPMAFTKRPNNRFTLFCDCLCH